ncbi:ABC transporter substrate-binding protein [Halopiger aswanensis]|uniref:Iron complex transport system substrate-binding protein n=1 Tax=Halopiger aswanensis TaxID=148449 RepID=A0A419WD83_9EURY|nr:ABC transporter substrate-binding protein [Halopiger aswanensis]RKD93276.1 iron complex transport system substrate-binding protein [Halopiger aswanensis]
MERNYATQDAATRRDWIKYGGAVVTGGLFAGCAGWNGSDSTSESTTDDGQSMGTDEAYEACIEPSGCHTFDGVPETYIVNNGEWADMAFALGKRNGFLTSTNMIPGFLFEPYGLDVPPVSETESLSAGGWDKEIFYELDPDVILMDPNYMHETGWDDSWDRSDTKEIRQNVAPFFGNNILRRREWHNYKLYSLYDAFERLADLFQEHDRYEALADIHRELRTEVRSRLPPEEERPEIALINSASDPSEGTFYPMNTQIEGIEMKPYRDLGIESAFSDEMVDAGTIDYEQLLEVDPEMIIVHWGIGTTGDTDRFSAAAFREQYVTPMEEYAVGDRLTAVRNGAIYPGAFGSQGPLVNLLQTEMVCQQLFPEEFGEFDADSFPDVPESNQLFDRQRVRDIIEGNI